MSAYMGQMRGRPGGQLVLCCLEAASILALLPAQDGQRLSELCSMHFSGWEMLLQTNTSSMSAGWAAFHLSCMFCSRIVAGGN